MDCKHISNLISEDITVNNGIILEDKLDIPTRKLGKTGFTVPILSLGGQGALESHGNEENCVKIIQRAYKLGVRYFDTSPVYGNSEDYYGKAIPSFRKKIFLATKTQERTYDKSMKLLEKSLKKLKTDYLDLWQLHNLTTMKEVNQITGRDGALKALLEMQEQGVVKHLGFTGHEDPDVLVEMSKRHDFDTVLCALNAADKHTKPSFIDTLLPVANKQKLGIIGMKVFSQGYIFHPKGITTSWDAINYVLSLPISTIIVSCDSVAQLEENVAIAKSFRKFDKSEMKEIVDRTGHYKRRASFFRGKYGGYSSKDKLGKPYIF